MSKAIIFFAQGCEECEGLLCVDILRRAGVDVTIAAVGGNKNVTSARKITVVADILAEDAELSAYDAVILPGGLPGVTNLKADAIVRKFCTEYAAKDKIVAAICAAPTALAEFGVLKGKTATVYPGNEDTLLAAGARDADKPVCVDGNIVTGEALGAGLPFALTLAGILASPEAAEKVKKGIVFNG